MDKIYSRKRIKIPRIKAFYSEKSKLKKVCRFLIIVAIAAITIYLIVTSVDPIFEGLCLEKAQTIATDIVNEESSKVLKGYSYNDIVSIIKDERTNILKTDVIVINNIAGDITTNISKRLEDLNDHMIEIPLGALLGNKFLTGVGPHIRISIVPIGAVNSEIKTNFISQGINQTMYRIYMELETEIKILMPYKTISNQIKNQVLLVETAIVGDVPSTYYNLNGLEQSDTLNLFE